MPSFKQRRSPAKPGFFFVTRGAQLRGITQCCFSLSLPPNH
jgi:hypothetical protein